MNTTTVLITIGLIILSALFSGLTLGLMSLGPHDLRRRMQLGDKNAEKVYAVRKKGNLLMVTLCLANTAVNAALSIFLGSIAPGVVAAIFSTLLITVFGEIAPQAIFSRFATELGAKIAWLVKILIFILYPVCAPIAWLLDRVLGEEMPTIYSKKELVSILTEHSDSKDSDVKAHEEKIARGALTFGEKTVSEVMTPRSVLDSVMEDEILTEDRVAELRREGHSRYPVFSMDKERLLGVLYIHDLAGSEMYDKTAFELSEKGIHLLSESDSLDVALRRFMRSKHHLFGVTNQFHDIVGVISIEDIIEEILGAEIVDEFDKTADMRKFAERA